MLDEMKKLLKTNDSCVLATCSGDRPHCSLMTYLTDVDQQAIYMVTHKATRKYANMSENPNVSLLIDTRSRADIGPGENIKALTVHGMFQPVDSEETQQAVLEQLIRRQPRIAALALDPDAVVFSVKVTSCLLLDGVKDAYYEALE